MLPKKRNTHLKRARQAKKLKYSNKSESSIVTNNNNIEVESELVLNQNFNTLNTAIYIPYDLSESESNESESTESGFNESESNESGLESENLFQELQHSTKLEFKLQQELHSKVNSISQNQLSRAIYMLNNMIYTKGKYQGELISEYSIASKDKTKAQHISKIRSAIQKAKKITPENFKKSAKKLFKFKNEYSVQFLQMATEISNLGQISLKSTVVCTKKFYEFITGEEPEKWINIHTLSRWNKEVAALQLDSNKPKSYDISNYGYGLLVDESKRGESKILIVATSF
ncbi:1003_t:CDS:2 [Cetraspora pellucida]|uniref:1003_t:CDS:1 n=1 Tax=Cetraspora pellucida TaxID=1433469 RepID=A0A9N9HVF5_9GLOM|nr:1003_t:CDS:2 [Cetraspora pellucida]